jgi:hypothetical protein
MSAYRNATFSVNQYDSDGDIVEECVLVHVGTTILRFTSVAEVDVFIKQLEKISSEIKANY